MSATVPPNPLPCGCKAVIPHNWDDTGEFFPEPHVIHCPLHAAAEKLREAVANWGAVGVLLETSPSLLATPDGERIYAIARMTSRAALAAAERTDP